MWSYNPQIENPHWIYPGDRIRMKEGGGPSSATLGEGFVSRQSLVPPGTIFLRNRGYIEDKRSDVWGTVAGSPDDQMLLADGDEIYLHIEGDREMKVGQELTVFTPERKPEAGDAKGDIVEIKGTARVTSYDSKTHVARARITESLDVIERGDLIGACGQAVRRGSAGHEHQGCEGQDQRRGEAGGSHRPASDRVHRQGP